MTTVLVTGIGGDIGQGVAAVLRDAHPEWRLLGMDIHSRHGGEHFVDAWHLAPRVPDPSYDTWLDELVAREGVTLVIPTSEAELIHFATTGRRSSGNASLLMPPANVVTLGSDKLATNQLLASIGVARPWTIPVEDLDHGATVALPCIYKTRRGAGSKGVFLCESLDDITFHRRHHPFAVLQERLEPADREVTCGVFRDRHGRTAVVQLLRSLVGGFTGWAEVIDDPAVTDQCRRVAEALDLRGAVNLQLRITEAGPRIFEMNPRFSSTVLMRHLLGFRDLVWMIDDAAGRDVTFVQPRVGERVVRVQGARRLT